MSEDQEPNPSSSMPVHPKGGRVRVRAKGRRAGFAIGPILYLLGLIGIGAGILFSGYSQILRSNIQITQDMETKNDLAASSTTLASMSTFSADALTFCPPPGPGASANCNPGGAITQRLLPFANVATADVSSLPSTSGGSGASALSSFVTSSGAPLEVGVFTGTTGLKQLDPYGHFYIYCRWENTRANGGAPALMIISAGPDDVLNTTCGDSKAQNDDSMTVLSVGSAIQRAAIWQTNSNNDTYYGATGTQLTITSTGGITVPGTLAVTSTGTSSFVGNVTAPNFIGNQSGGSISATSGAFSGNVGVGGTLGVTGDMALGGQLGVTGAATLSSTLGVTGDTTLSGQLGVTGAATLSSTLGVTGLSTFTGGLVDSNASGTALSVTGTSVLGGTTTAMQVFINPFGQVIANGGFIGSLQGSQSGGSISATNGSFSGALQVNDGLTVTGASNFTLDSSGNGTFAGTVTAANFSGNFNFGSGGGATITGVVPLANGGTGYSASSALDLLAYLGGTNASNLSSGTLASGLFAGNSVPSAALENLVTPGTYYAVSVNAEGLVTGGSGSPTIGNYINDGSGDSVVASGGAILFTTSGDQNDAFNDKGYLGILTTNPTDPLSVGTAYTPIDGNEMAQFGTGGATSYITVRSLAGSVSSAGLLGVTTSGTNSTVYLDTNASSGTSLLSFRVGGTQEATIGAGGVVTATVFDGASAAFSGTVTANSFNGNSGYFTGTVTANSFNGSTGYFTGTVTAASFSGNITGNISLTDGTAATPGLYFTSETDTGLFRHGTDEFGFAVGGVEALELETAASAVDYLTITPAAAGAAPVIGVAGSANEPLTISSAGSGNITLTPGSSGKVNISAGALNIASASSGLQLNGNNGISVPGNDASGGSLAVGTGALAGLQSITSGYNTAVGYQALNANTTGVGNVAIGYSALSTGEGSNDVAIGYNAGLGSPGVNDVIVGAEAGVFGGGGNAVAIGYNAGGAWQNVSVGAYAGQNTTAYLANGVYVGQFAGRFVSSGVSNTAIGQSALAGSTTYRVTGSYNTAVGDSSMYAAQTTANENTALGQASLYNLTIGANNVALGFGTGVAVVGGSGNILIGSGVNTPSGVDSSNTLNIGNLIFGDLSGIHVGIGAVANTGAALDLYSQSSTLILPGNTSGTSGRPLTSLENGMIRYNSNTPGIEAYINNAWVTLLNDTTSGMSPSLYLGTQTTANPEISGEPTSGFYTPGANTIAVETAGTTALTITSTQSIGIGTTSPNSAFQVHGGTNENLVIGAPLSVSGATQIGTINDANTLSTPLEIRSSFTVFSAGNVAIGGTTSAADKLDVAGAIGLTTTATLPINGIYSPAAGQLALVTTGATAMTITSTGSVGIGLTNPGAPLQVSAFNSGVALPLILSNSNTGFAAGESVGIEFYNGGTPGNEEGAILVDNETNGDGADSYMAFYTRQNDALQSRMVIDKTGNVGIGTTSPTAGVALDLLSNTTTSNSSLGLPGGSTANRPTTGVAGMLRYNSSTPGLEAYYSGAWQTLFSSAATMSSGIYLGSATTANPQISGEPTSGFYTPGANTIAAETGGTTALTITSTQSIGIGTTAPAYPLDVAGGSIRVLNGTGNATIEIAGVATDTYGVSIDTQAGTNSSSLRLNPANGVVQLYNSTRSYTLDIYNADTPAIELAANGSSYFNGGNVGIGTTSPTAGVALDLLSNTTTANSSLGLPGGSTANRPTTGVAGMLRYNSSTPGLEAYYSGAWQTLFSSAATMSSGIYLGSATTANPQISGEPTSGFYTPGANTIAAETGGTTALTITSTQSIGIATANPATLLQVGTSSNASGAVFSFSNNANGAYPGSGFGGALAFNFSGGGGEFNLWNQYTSATTSFQFSQLTGTGARTDIMTLMANGSVGIGTRNPTAGVALDLLSNTTTANSSLGLPGGSTANRPTTGVAGMLRYNSSTPGLEAYYSGAWQTLFSSAATMSSGIYLGSATTANPQISGEPTSGFYTPGANTIAAETGGTTALTITSTQSIGIGTTAPGYNLTVNPSGTTAIVEITPQTWAGPSDYAEIIMGSTSHTIEAIGGTGLQINDTAGIFLTGSNVGIGTTASTAGVALDMLSETTTSNSSLGLPGGSTANRPATGVAGMLRYNSSTPGLEAYYSGAWQTLFSSATTMSSGIYLGSATTANPQISGEPTSGFYTPGANTIAAETGGTTALTITSTQSIGIGTTAPNAPLQVLNSAAANTGYAGYFLNAATSGHNYGVWGQTNSNDGGAVGVVGNSPNGAYGVYGEAESTSAIGVNGLTVGGSYGMWGETDSNANGVAGIKGLANVTTGNVKGVYGQTNSNNGSASGVYGVNTAGGGGTAVWGNMTGAGNTGNAGYFTNTATTANYGVYATTASSGAGTGIYGSITGASNTGYAGYFSNTSTTGWAIYANGGAPSYFGGSIGVEAASPISLLANTGSNVLDAFGNGVNRANGLAWRVSSNTAGYVASFSNGVTTNPANGVLIALADTSGNARALEVESGSISRFLVSSNGSVGIGTTAPTAGVALDLLSNTTTANSSLGLPGGSTTNRPTTGVAGMLRYNSTTPGIEAYYSGAWQTLLSSGGSTNTNLGSATTANPQISGEPTSGFYTPGANTIGVETNGITALTITATQSIGIGTTAPGRILDVQNASADSTAQVKYTGSATNYAARSFIATNLQSWGFGTAYNYNSNDLFIYDATNSVEKIQIYPTNTGQINLNPFGGNVGIGTTSPNYTLDVEQASAATSGNVGPVGYHALTVSPTASSSAIYYAGENYANLATNYNLTGSSSPATGSSINGAYNAIFNSGTGTIATSDGATDIVVNNSTGTITTAYGALNRAINNSTGTIANAFGAANVTNDASTGPITNAWGTLSRVNNQSTGTVTTAYSIQADLTNSGTVGTWYGLYIPAVSGTAPTTAYDLYIADTNNNYFAGNVGIGTTTPQSVLDVAGGEAIGSYAGVNAAPSNGLIVSGNVGIGTTVPTAGVALDMLSETTTSNSSLGLPGGSTANRPTTGVAGMLRYNSTTPGIEAYYSGAWNALLGSGGSTSISLLGSATTANPEISGEPTSGFYTPGANTIAVETAGNTAMTITSTGSVGIGTAAPNAPLQVSSSPNLGTFISQGSESFYGTNDSYTPTVTFAGTGVANAVVYGADASLSVSNVSFAIGTIGLGSYPHYNFYGAYDSSTGSPTVNLTGRATIGNYGVSGISALSATLTAVGSNSAIDSYGGYFIDQDISSGNANLAYSSYGAYIGNASSLSATGTTIGYGAYISGTARAATNYGLYVFASTTTGTTNYGAYISQGGGATTNYGLYLAGTSAATDWSLYSNGTAPSYFAGNVGIGTTTPQSVLDVAGGEAIGSYAGVNAAPSNGLIVSGNVGIGTTVPTAGVALDMLSETTTSNSSLGLPGGSTANRPTTGVAGMLRYNSTTPGIEAYYSGAWNALLGSGGSTSISLLGSATTANPEISGEPTSGFYTPGANTIGVETAGSTALTITATQSIGIGTTAPSSPLTVFSNAPNGLTMTGSSSNSIGAAFTDTITGGHGWSIASSGSGPAPVGDLLFYDNTASGARMVIDTSGNVGIGTTAPTANLDVYGSNTYLKIRGTGQTTFQIYNTAAGTDQKTSEIYDQSGTIVFRTVNDAYSLSQPYMTVTRNSATYSINNVVFPNGSVGIGTTAPDSKLTVSANVSAAPALPSDTIMHLQQADGAFAREVIDTFGAGGTGSVMSFRGAEGTAASPTASLSGDVLGQFTAIGYGATGYSAASRAKISMSADQNWTDTAQGTYITFGTTPDGSTTTSEVMRIAANGYVGIGTTVPLLPLQVYGIPNGPTSSGSTQNGMMFVGGSGGNGLFTGVLSGSPYSVWMQSGFQNPSTGAWYPISLNPLGGNVGIGTTVPTAGVALDMLSETTTSNSSLGLPGGSTANRPTTGVAGMLRYNSTTPGIEAYYSGAWNALLSSGGSTGISLLGSATTANPQISGEPTSGFYTPGANTIAAETGGTTALTITSTQSIGIGTTAPNAPLQVLNSAAANTGYAGYFLNAATSGHNYGVWGQTNSNDGGAVGVVGNSPNGAYGVYGEAESTSAIGVNGLTVGGSYGMWGETDSNANGVAGIKGLANVTTGNVKGVYGQTNSNNGSASGVYGVNTAGGGGTAVWGNMTGAGNTGNAGYFTNTATTANYGVYATTASSGAGTGIYGSITGASNTGYAGYFSNTSTTGWAIYANGGAPSYFGGSIGVEAASPISLLANTGSNVLDAFGNGVNRANGLAWRVSSNTAGYVASFSNGVTTNPANGVLIALADTSGNARALEVESGSISRFLVSSNGSVGIGTTAPTAGVALDLLSNTTTANSSLGLPGGSTTNRPTTGVAGMLRYNSTTPGIEAYYSGAWQTLLSSGGSTNTNLGSATTANPQISGEPTSGFYTPGANTIGVETNGITALTITATQSIGIGTAAPSGPLHVYATASADSSNYFQNTASGYAEYVRSYSNAGNAEFVSYNGTRTWGTGEEVNNWVLHDWTANTYPVTVVAAAPSNSLYINGSGNVGIGTTAPGRILDVQNASADSTAQVKYTGSATNYAARSFIATNLQSWGFGTAYNYNSNDLFIYDATNSVEKIQIYPTSTGQINLNPFGGNVGIGTTSPNYTLDVEQASAATSGNVGPVGYHALTINPTAGSSGTYIGSESYANIATTSTLTTTASSNGFTNGVNGAFNAAYNNNTATVGNTYGAYNISNNYSTGTITNALGALNRVWNTSTGTITNAFGSQNVVNNGSTGVIATAAGILSRVNNSTGTITTAYSIQADLTNSGTVGTWYGLYIPAVSGTAPTTAYDLYIADTNNNYFAGKIGIGTSAPGSTLDINGSEQIDAGGTLTMNGSTSGSVKIGTAAAAGTGTVFQLPATNGTSGYYLQTNGSGITSWQAVSASTGVTLGSVTTANPAIAAEPTSGFYTSGANTIGVETNGSTALTITATQSVGIGTTAPARVLDIVSNGGMYQERFSDGTNEGGAGADNNGFFRMVGTIGGALGYGSAAGSTFTEVMRVTTSGDVGIGTTVPGTTLDVNGTTTLRSTFEQYGGFAYLGEDNTTGNPVQHVTNPSLAVSWNGTGGSGETDLWNTYTAASTAFTFKQLTTSGSAHTDLMTILSSGNVGIDSTSPAEKLDVQGMVAIGTGTTAASIESTAGGLTVRGSSSNFVLDTNDGGGRVNYVWNATGGTGTYLVASEPAARFVETVNSTTGAEFEFLSAPAGTVGSTVTWTQIADLTGQNDVWFSPRGTNSDFYINTSGDVGIGTASPQNTLHVNGGITTSGGGSAPQAAGPSLTMYDSSATGYIQSIYNGVAWEPLNVMASTFSFLSNGSTQGLYQNSSGYVGIGLTSPGAPLDVESNYAYTTNCGTESSSCPPPPGAGYGTVLDSDYDNGQYRYRLLPTDRGGNISFYVQEAGNTANTFFNIARFGNNQYDTNSFAVFGAANITGNLTVGGTFSPASISTGTLTVTGNYIYMAGGTGSVNATGGPFFYSDTSNAVVKIGSGGGGLLIQNYSGTNATYLNTNGSSYITGGNVGIGTTAPSAPLEVIGAAATPTYSTSNSFNPSGAIFAIQGYGNGLTVGVYGSAGGYASWLQSGYQGNIVAPYPMLLNPFGGDVGIGTTTPGETLDVNGIIRSNNDIISTGVAGDGANIRMIGGSYGAMFRQDGSNIYLLLTASGSQYGSWNSLRPFTVNDASGAVSIDGTAAGTTFGGNITFSAANPTITSGGSYIIIPDGLYVSGGTLYSSAPIEARGGIYDDTAAYLTINGGTSGNTYFPGNIGFSTGSPVERIDIEGSTASNGIKIGNSGGDWMQLYDDGNAHLESGTGSNIWIGANNAAPIEIATGGGAVNIGSGGLTVNSGISITSSNVLYFSSYGGGWYMSDGTWIRSYGSKSVYMNSGFDTGNPSGVGCGGGLGGGYTFDVCGTANVTSNLSVSGNIYWGTGGNWLSAYLNQAVTTGSSPTFANLYLNGSMYMNATGAEYQDDGNIYMTWAGTWLSTWVGQNVSAGANPTFNNILVSSVGCCGSWLSNLLNQPVLTSSYPTFAYGPVVSSYDGSVLALGFNYGSSYLQINANNGTDYGVTAWVSDEHLKKNITDSQYQALDKLNQIRFISFDWKKGIGHDNNPRVSLGFSAQDLKKIDPQWVNEVPQVKGKPAILIPNETTIIPAAVKGVVELSKKLDDMHVKLTSIIDGFAGKIESLMTRVSDHDEAIKKLQVASDNKDAELKELRLELRADSENLNRKVTALEKTGMKKADKANLTKGAKDPAVMEDISWKVPGEKAVSSAEAAAPGIAATPDRLFLIVTGGLAFLMFGGMTGMSVLVIRTRREMKALRAAMKRGG